MFPFDAAQMEQQEVTAMPPVIVSGDKTIAPADQAEAAASAAEPTPSKQELPRLIPLVSPSSPAANAASATLPQPHVTGPRSEEFNDRTERPGRGEFGGPRFDYSLTAEEKKSKGVVAEEPNPRATFRFRVSVVLLFLAVAVASASLYKLWATEREARWAAVHLDAQRDAGGLLLTWDAGAPVVAKAVRGLLQVNDGRTPATVQLSQEQLLQGSVTYPDTGPNVLFSLSLDGGGTKTVTESLRVITSNFPGKAPTPPAGKVAARSAQAVKSAKSAPETESTSVGSGPATGMKIAKPVSVRREIRPEIPEGIRSRIATQKVVEVQVRIDENGRVTSASSTASGNGVDQYLADQAVKAARQWLFWPARSTAGEPVSATKTISFEFAPGAH
jgi:TonB family protein